MDNIFKNIPLEGTYKEVFDEFIKETEVPKEIASNLEVVVGLMQLITNAEKLPLQIELDSIKAELKEAKEQIKQYKAKAMLVDKLNKKLQIENDNLLSSLKAMKELSVMEDQVEAVTTSYTDGSTLDPTFLTYIQKINKTRNNL